MSRRRMNNERGAVLPMFGITIVVLMAMSAFAVDLGLLFSERREDQAAVDVGTIGGAMNYLSGLTSVSEEAAALVRVNLDTQYDDAAWAAMWAACTDSGAYRFTGTVLGTATNCISISPAGTLRVTAPDQEVETAFASVLGINAFSSSAVAEVELEVYGVGGVLPFAILGGAGTGDLMCLRSASGGTATPPCDGSASGNFGALQSGQWGNPAMGTDGIGCSINKSDQLAVNISVGLDHIVVPFAGTARLDDCANQQFGPNMLNTFQGISGGVLEGFIEGVTVNGTYFPGRLTQTQSSTVTFTSRGNRAYEVDDQPLWEYIRYGHGAGVPANCTRESFEATVAAGATVYDGHAAAELQVAACLTAYVAGGYTTTLFDVDANADGVADIIGTTRFGAAPQFIETIFPTGDGYLTIGEFRGVFISGLHMKCNGVDCDLIHTPGSMPGGVRIPNGANIIDQTTAFLLPNNTLPPSLLEDTTGGKVKLYDVHLSY